MTKKIVILGGGTNTYISNHLALSAPAYGNTARELRRKFLIESQGYSVNLVLTKMADPSNKDAPDTPEEVEAVIDQLIADPDVRVIVFNVAMVDYKPTSLTEWRRTDKTLGEDSNVFGKYERRLSTTGTPVIDLELQPYNKIINKIRKTRKDIFLVGFKTTCGATQEEQFNKGLKLVKEASCNIVFANDVDKARIDLLNNSLSILEERMQSKDPVKHRRQGLTKSAQCSVDSLRNNALITPEESSYWYNTRDEALDALVAMTLSRIKGEFTRTTEVEGNPVQAVTSYIGSGSDSTFIPVTYNTSIPSPFMQVLSWLISQGAYKKNVMGKTPGHFGIKLSPTTSLCSIRKQDYTDLRNLKLVKVEQKQVPTYPDLDYWESALSSGIADSTMPNIVWKDIVEAQGAKPSVGDATQRELFKYNPEMDFIIHFHCPLQPNHSLSIPIVKQFGYECGSHGETSCSKNTRTGMKAFQLPSGSYVYAVHLDHHGPNIMFNRSVDIEELKTFISFNWDLSKKDDGLC